MKHNDYNDFLDEYRKLKKLQKEQRKRGLNDYNLLTTVLEAHDEVRLHSKVIGSLLDPNGLHYQDELFLEIFLETLNIKEFNLNMQISKLQLEHEQIDLYLTDGSKHIIIENKVHAADQPSQIKRYMEKVFEKNEGLLDKDVFVIYLSLGRDKPSDVSLGKEQDNQMEEYFELNAGKLVYKGQKNKLLKNKSIQFKSIHYENEILEWLEKSKYEIQNISNLNRALTDYSDVVKMINNKYKEKILKLEDMLLEDSEKYQLAKEISEAFKKAEMIKEKQRKELNLTEVKFILEEKGMDYKELKGNEYAVNISLEYRVKIIALEDSFLIQVTDRKKPFELVDRSKKEEILKDLEKIDNRFKSSYNRVYGAMEIESKDNFKQPILQTLDYCKRN